MCSLRACMLHRQVPRFQKHCLTTCTCCSVRRRNQWDFSGVDFSANATRGGQATDLTAIRGYTPDAGSSGVYAWTNGPAGGIPLSPGRNFLQLLHPNRKESRSVPSFVGKFMYRIHDARAPRSLNSAMVGQSLVDILPELQVGVETLVEHLALPEQSLHFRVNHEFTAGGYALQGFDYTVKYTGNGFGSLVQNDLQLGLPQGYTAYAEANLTFSNAPSNLEADSTHALYLNATQTGKFTSTSGVGEVQFGSDTTTIRRSWRVPLDVATSAAADSPLFGVLSVPGPSMLLGSSATTFYDWSIQSSPFADVAVTVNSVTPYPQLSELSELHLRNWDDDASNGHSATDPTTQNPFAIYRVRLDSPLWWRMNIRFNDVRDMNRPAGVSPSEPPPPLASPCGRCRWPATCASTQALLARLPPPQVAGEQMGLAWGGLLPASRCRWRSISGRISFEAAHAQRTHMPPC